MCCSNSRLFALVPIRKAGKGGVHPAGRVCLSTPCVRKLSKAERACIRRWRAIVKFTSIAVVELLSRSSRHALIHVANTGVCPIFFFQLYFPPTRVHGSSTSDSEWSASRSRVTCKSLASHSRVARVRV